MPPKNRTTKAPTVVADADRRVMLDTISLGELSGWRKTRPGRRDELQETFLGGAFQQSTFGEVSLLQKSDEDGKWIIDDGLATTQVLADLERKWKEDGGKDPTGEPWHQNLVDVFEKGMPVKWLVYEDDTLALRKLFNIGKHDESNNKFDASSVAQKVEAAQDALRAAAGDASRARNDMLAVLGDGAMSNIKRWLRASAGLAAEVVAELHTVAWLPEAFIFDNYFFVGGGATSSDKQLLPYFQLKALELTRKNRDDNEGKLTYIAKTFTVEVCHAMKLVDLWKRHLGRKLGAVATTSQAVARLVEHLTTKTGLSKVQGCIASNVPCHGNGGSESGIPECRALYQELERCKAGGLPPLLVQPDLAQTPAASSGGVDPSSGGVGPNTDEAMRIVSAFADEHGRVELCDVEEDDSGKPDGVSKIEFEMF